MASHPGHQKSELSRKLITSLYPIAVRNEFPLPSCFNKKSKLSNITLWDNRRKITDSRTQSDETLPTVSVLANRPIPLCCSLYYYEVTVNAKSRSGCLLVGFFVSSQTEQKHKSSGTVIVYNSNTGRISVNEEQLPPVGPPFGEGDIIGCGVNFVTNSVFFTKNGLLIGLTNVSPQLTTAVFPCVQMVSPTTQLTGNFGHQDFYFAIGQHMAQERSSAVCQAVDNKLTSELANSKMRSLVFDYLLRHGFSDTAIALAPIIENAPTAQPTKSDNEGEVQFGDGSKMSDSAGGDSTAESAVCGAGEEWPESFEAVKRRINLIRLIEAGHFLEAIAELSANYANLVHQAPAIVFMLRCRHFIEMAFRCNANGISSEVSTSTDKPPPKTCHHNGSQKRTQPSSSPECSPELLSSLSSRRCEAPAPVRMKLGSEDEFFTDTAYSDDFRQLFGDSQEQLQEDIGVCGTTEGSVMVAETVHTNINGFTAKKREAAKRALSPVVATVDETAAATAAVELYMNGDGHTATSPPPALPLSNGVSAGPPAKLPSLPVGMSGGPAVFGLQATGSVLQQGSRDSQQQMETTGESTSLKQAEPAQTSLRDLLDYGRALRNLAQDLRASGLISFAQLSLMENAFNLVAYENPIDSPFGDLAHFRHRKLLADSVNNTILAHLGKSGFPLLETGISILEQTVMGVKFAPKSPNKVTDARKTLQPSFSSSETLTPLQPASSTTSTAMRTSTAQEYLHPIRNLHHRSQHHHTGTSTTLVITSTSTVASQHTSASTSTETRSLRPVYPLPFFASSTVSTGSASEVFAVPVSHITQSTTTESASGGGTSAGGRFRSTIVQSSPFPVVSPPPTSEGDEFTRLFNAYMQGPQVYIHRLQRNHRHTAETPSRDSGARSSSPSGGQKYSSTSAAVAAVAAAADALATAGVLVPGSEFAGFFHPTLFL
ncbi:hypothetical protein AAHC03_027175 [Spirometra sp. Aus1]